MTDLLERRYRRLMFVYPKSHRGRWESEILGTLLELAGPAQRMPAGREAASLCLGG
ncbi:MAG: hypothetical protein HKP61_02615, partial [Dactylosporangium sp.]|nr:hypothetical protein [Dactylosporangium sp.]